LTKNVHRGHLEEIFGEYGRVTGCDLPVFKVCELTAHLEQVKEVRRGDWWSAFIVAGLNRGKAALEFERSDLAEKAVKCMDGGQLDGSFLTVQVGVSFV